MISKIPWRIPWNQLPVESSHIGAAGNAKAKDHPKAKINKFRNLRIPGDHRIQINVIH